jgi:fucose permease
MIGGMGGMGALAIATTFLPVILPVAARDFLGAAGVSYERMGRLMALLSAGFVGALLSMGPASDRWGPKPFALGGCLLVALGLLGFAASQGYVMAMLMAPLVGWGAGTLDMVLSPIVASAYPERRVAALNRLHSAYSLTAVAATGWVAVWLQTGGRWGTVLAWLALEPALGGVWLSACRLRQFDSARVGSAGLKLARHPGFLAWAFVLFATGTIMAGVAQWLPIFAQQQLHLPRTRGGLFLSAFLLAGGLSRLSVGWILQHGSAAGALAAGLAGSVALLVLAATIPSPVIALAALVGTGFTSGLLWPTVLGAASEELGQVGGTLFGWLSAAGNTGCLIAPWAIGLLADQVGLKPTLVLPALPATIALGVVYLRTARVRI